MKNFDFTDDTRKNIIAATGHIIVEGGPGSGKTTIALAKAKNLIESGVLFENQKVLFLSFARATISRIEQQLVQLISGKEKRQIEINTYHSFCWSIIQSFGYLLSNRKSFSLITPPNLAASLAAIPEAQRHAYKMGLFDQGIICFDLFAEIVTKILNGSDRISNILSTAYPFIIVDEFQDTDTNEWHIIQRLGEKSKIIALADLEQRIYDFRGASITRIPQFITHFNASKFDLGKENNRSSDTDIVEFGNDLLTGRNREKQYRFVKIIRYPFYKGEAQRLPLKSAIFEAIKRLKRDRELTDWSLAILVNSKQDTLTVSSYLTGQRIGHEVLIDPSGPSLAAEIIAYLLQPISDVEASLPSLINKLVGHIRGRKKAPSKADLLLSEKLQGYIETGKIKGANRQAIITDLRTILQKRTGLLLSGTPSDDWTKIRTLFLEANSACVKDVYLDALYIKLLHKGAILNESLGSMWRDHGSYLYALESVAAALVQEHFSMAQRVWKGIFVMNIHKCKGKEFDEVIIWEELHRSIVRQSEVDKGRLLLRVAVTRAKSFTTFLTPTLSPCILV